jgi:hypothetical protein
LTAQPYVYGSNSAVGRIDPSGRSYYTDVGVAVHQAICRDFLALHRNRGSVFEAFRRHDEVGA